MPITTVKAISQTFKKFKTIMNQPGKGHKAILSAATVGEISKDHSFRITEFGSILGSLCLQIHHKTSPPCQQTVWKKPLLSFCHKQKQLVLARRLWKCNCGRTKQKLSSPRSRWAWCRNKVDYREKHLIPCFKYGGGSVMLWSCFSSKDPGSIILTHGIRMPGSTR